MTADHPLKALDLVIGATERDAAVASAVEVERNSKRARRTEQRRHIKDMQKLGYEVTGTGPDGQMTFRKVTTWHEETAVPSCAGEPRETSGSSHGPSKAALASAARAQRAARKLKASSANGSAREADDPARVIPLKCS